MGKLVDGVWNNSALLPASKDGGFVRADSSFRDVVVRDPKARFTAEAGRYLLYVSYACPWAHRTLIVRAMKGLEAAIPIAVVDPHVGDQGWVFSDGPGCIPDPLGAKELWEVYVRADARYTGKVTVPVLWDTKEKTVVSNESSEIIRMFDDAFDPLSARPLGDLYPAKLRPEIDAINQRIYDTVNNGVYKAGFSFSQSKYEEAFTALFETLDFLEARLAKQPFLAGDVMTEADIRLVTTLFRFDSVYYVHFKCNQRRIVDYENLWAFTRQMYQAPHVAETLNMHHIKQHYYTSHPQINPTRIVPKGPLLDFYAAHARGPIVTTPRVPG